MLHSCPYESTDANLCSVSALLCVVCLRLKIEDELESAEKKRQKNLAEKKKVAQENNKKGNRARARHQVALQQAQALEAGGEFGDGDDSGDDDSDDGEGKEVEY